MAAWEDWSAALARARLGITPAELHGSVTGYLCAGWSGRPRELLAALQLEGDDAGEAENLHLLLDGLVVEIAAALRARDTVTPLLPPGPLPVRADATVDWCRGFLGGLGLTGVLGEHGHASQVRVVLDNFGRIAAMHLECDDDDEASLAEVLDFIRAGVLHLHTALAPAGRR